MDIAVAFDLDHTLCIDQRLEKTVALEMLDAYARKRDVAYDRPAAEAAIDGVLHAYRTGEQTVEAAIAGFFERFTPGGGSYIVDEAQVFRENVLARAAQFVKPLSGAQAMLAACDELAIPYAVLTNGWSPLQEEKARLIGFHGPVFVSERIGARKPSREAFDVLAKHFDLPFGRIWYVGDDPTIDCGPAEALGMVSVWFDWENRSYPADLAAPQHTIHALADVRPLVEGRVSAAANPSA